MKKKTVRHPDLKSETGRAYPPIIAGTTTTTITPEDDLDTVRAFIQQMGSVEGELDQIREWGCEIIRRAGYEPDDYLSLTSLPKSESARYGADMIFHAESAIRFLAQDKARSAAHETALAVFAVHNEYIFRHQLEIRIGQKHLTKGGGRSKKYPTVKLQKVADKYWGKHPDASKSQVARHLQKNGFKLKADTIARKLKKPRRN